MHPQSAGGAALNTWRWRKMHLHTVLRDWTEAQRTVLLNSRPSYEVRGRSSCLGRLSSSLSFNRLVQVDIRRRRPGGK